MLVYLQYALLIANIRLPTNGIRRRLRHFHYRRPSTHSADNPVLSVLFIAIYQNMFADCISIYPLDIANVHFCSTVENTLPFTAT